MCPILEKNKKKLPEEAQLGFFQETGVFLGVILKHSAHSHIWNPKTSICIGRG